MIFKQIDSKSLKCGGLILWKVVNVGSDHFILAFLRKESPPKDAASKVIIASNNIYGPVCNRASKVVSVSLDLHKAVVNGIRHPTTTRPFVEDEREDFPFTVVNCHVV